LSDLAALLGLLASAFMSATILPGSSEIVMVGLLTAGYGAALLVAVATLGNVAGAVVNWCIGRGVERYRDRKWFPVSEAKLVRAKDWYRRWGRWSLLLSWAPLAGDALTVAAGVMREPLPSFVALVTLAKGARYVAVALAALAVI
jgi:membrane protein YqaA with SNARE-associated domain